MNRLRLFALLGSVLLSGCATYGTIENRPLVETAARGPDYSMADAIPDDRRDNVTLVLAFSGGGSRAAALSYGVLQELRDTTLPGGKRLLDEVDAISAVSGGSFTAAYYGLHGDGLHARSQLGELMAPWESVASARIERAWNGRRLRIRLVPPTDPRFQQVEHATLAPRVFERVSRVGLRYSLRILDIGVDELREAFVVQSGGRVRVGEGGS